MKAVADTLGVSRSNLVEGLEDRTSAPSRVWNRIPAHITGRIITMALDHADLSPRELAVKFTDTERYFMSDASVYRLLKAHVYVASLYRDQGQR